MLEVNQQEEEKKFSYRLLTGMSFILSHHTSKRMNWLPFVCFHLQSFVHGHMLFPFFKPKWPYSLKCIF